MVVGYLYLAALAINLLFDALFGPGTYKSTALGPAWAAVLAGALTVAMGRRLNHGPVPIIPRPAGTVFAPRVPFLFAPHSLLFVPMEAWGALEISVGTVTLVGTILGG